MEGGQGVTSYARNSSTQGTAFSLIFPAIQEVISGDKYLGNIIRIADLGCSSGPNTINAVDSVVEAFKGKFRVAGTPEPHIQAFFSDLTSTDFNTLFQLLFEQRNSHSYYIAGVPGSFYDRLFPPSFIHFAMSNVALHWLSKVPDAVLDKTSTCWSNKVTSNGANVDFVQAYQQQAHQDFCKFLEARAEELVCGGILSLFMNGRNSEDPTKQTDAETYFLAWTTSRFELALQDMVTEGLIDEQAQNSFKIPAFHRAEVEVTQAVKETGKFNILRLETVDFSMPSYGAAVGLTSPEAFARKEATFTKSVTKWIAEAVFKGDQVLVDKLYERMERHLLPIEPFVPSRGMPMLFTILERASI